MRKVILPQFSLDQAAALLGVAPTAGSEALRRAYLEQVQAHPPDSEPELFERIRDAYEQLRNPALHGAAGTPRARSDDAPHRAAGRCQIAAAFRRKRTLAECVKGEAFVSDGEEMMSNSELVEATAQFAKEQSSLSEQSLLPSEHIDSSSAQNASPPEHSSLSPEARQRLIRQFEQWLDQMSAGESAPTGLPEELIAEIDAETGGAGAAARDCDLYTLFAGFTTLSGEIRLQGRAFKQLIDALSPLSQLPQQIDRLENDLQGRSALQAAPGELPVSAAEICTAMLDLYDRLNRGLGTCDRGLGSLKEQHRRGWLRRWFGEAHSQNQAIAAIEALRDAAGLTLARLEAVLDQWGMERIGRTGESFDPLRMTAMHVRPRRGIRTRNRAGSTPQWLRAPRAGKGDRAGHRRAGRSNLQGRDAMRCGCAVSADFWRRHPGYLPFCTRLATLLAFNQMPISKQGGFEIHE